MHLERGARKTKYRRFCKWRVKSLKRKASELELESQASGEPAEGGPPKRSRRQTTQG
jgi:hypothetical protein